jgi:hypothetical protein
MTAALSQAQIDFFSKLAACRTLIQFQRLGVLCGFELETESTEGVQWDDDNYWDNDVPFSVPSGMEVKEDCSVPGFEFATRDGGLRPSRWLKQAKQIFRLDHEIGTGCSFHTHVSFRDVPLRDWICLQPFATEYLVDNFKHDAPKGVMKRLTSGSMWGWAQPRWVETHNKGCAVSVRSKTFEYRLWGNVASYKDALRCLQMTLRSLAYAAQSVLAGCRPVGWTYDRDWSKEEKIGQEVQKIMENGGSLRTFFEGKEAAAKAKADRELERDIAASMEYTREELRARHAGE